MNEIDAPNVLQHRLVYDDLQMARHPWISEIDRAIRENPDCETGLMARQGWAYSVNGPTSDGNRDELLVLVTRGIRRSPASDNWYGHVFFRSDAPEGNRTDPESKGKWVSVLVRTWVLPDSANPDTVLRQWRALVVTGHKWVPGYYQECGDTCARRPSFEDAVRSLIHQIRRFRRAVRVERITGYDDYGDFRIPAYEDPVDGIQDLGPMALYRFGEQLCKAFSDQEGAS